MAALCGCGRMVKGKGQLTVTEMGGVNGESRLARRVGGDGRRRVGQGPIEKRGCI